MWTARDIVAFGIARAEVVLLDKDMCVAILRTYRPGHIFQVAATAA